MARVLVTGGNGQVGFCLAQRLPRRHDVLITDKTSLDITNPQSVDAVFSSFCPDMVINAAAYTAVDKAETEVALASAINVDGVRYLAQACERVSAAFLHISTDYVFDGEKSVESTYDEDDAVAPQGVYGETKLKGEREALHACSKTLILRTAWVFGEHGHNFVKTMLRLAQSRPQLGIVADQFGGPTYAGDIANALMTMVDNIAQHGSVPYGIYHYSGFPYVSWHQFAMAIFSEAKNQGLLSSLPDVKAISTQEYPTPAKRPTNSKLNLGKIKQTFDIAPSDWQKALKNLKAYM